MDEGRLEPDCNLHFTNKPRYIIRTKVEWTTRPCIVFLSSLLLFCILIIKTLISASMKRVNTENPTSRLSIVIDIGYSIKILKHNCFMSALCLKCQKQIDTRPRSIIDHASPLSVSSDGNERAERDSSFLILALGFLLNRIA